MHFVPLEAIIVPEGRQRVNFDSTALSDLARSIGEVGLLQPLVCRKVPAGWELVAGERRLRALKTCAMLGRYVSFEGQALLSQAPVLDLGELDDAKRYQVELEENTVRMDLTWQERAQAAKRLAELHGGEKPHLGIAADMVGPYRNPGPVAAELRQAIIVADHLGDPDVAKASTVRDAFKILKTKENLARARASVALNISNDLQEQHQIYQGDVLDWLATYEGPPFDVLCTDPPYGMGASSFGDSGGKMQVAHAYDDSPESFHDLMQDWIPLASQVLVDNAHVYQFCDFDMFVFLKGLWLEQRFEVFRTPILWHKPSGYRAPWPEKGPQRKYECILYAVRGNKITRRLGGDVITLNNDSDSPHAARKPVGLFVDLLSRSCLPGERVLDCFAGSGPMLAAAHQLQLSSVSIDSDAASVGMCIERRETLK